MQGPTKGAVAARLQAWWSALPLTTRSVFAGCTGLLLAGSLFGWHNQSVCTGPWLVVGRGQVWRLLSSAWFHVGLLHWLMNMSALCTLLPSLERAHGSVGAAVVVLVYSALANILALVPITVIYGVTGFDTAFGVMSWRECSLGLSGVLFALLTLESTTDDTGLLQRHRLLCGIAVPAAAYPWVLLVLLQILLPGASFMGHLGGIAAAHLLNPLKLRAVVSAGENVCPQRVKSIDSFIPANRIPLPYAAPESAMLQSSRTWLARWLHDTVTPQPVRSEGDDRFPGKGRSMLAAEQQPKDRSPPRGDATLRSASGETSTSPRHHSEAE
eukprot:TRINITY_DN28355_c1_g1_i1.p1 TRINITY_DN28355_c1_g1~~TRINITY_DN28355_c1_g1_i1.p1  ORF type:complete len:346 (+),score=62.89 TRINITY_DN28355_c1_g1_i1:58-1038(+)